MRITIILHLYKQQPISKCISIRELKIAEGNWECRFIRESHL